jgi:nucleotidyltransferase substrate binding protein (TIGR01987 family)
MSHEGLNNPSPVDKLDLGPLERAIERLREGWERYQKDVTDTHIRDGLIQRFEFTYEISHKTLKRYLEQSSSGSDEYDRMAFADLIRSGNEQGLLLGAWPDWRRYREMRSKTSHTYDEGIALEVVDGILLFLKEACYLRDALKARLR